MKLIGFIGIVLMAVMVGCKPPTTSPRPSHRGEGVASLTLENIDSLMWWRADSALAVMMEFAGSPEADGMDVFEGHYCQVLIAELLFKNDYGQSNREEVLKAVNYFDSIVGMDVADARGASVQRRDAFLAARAHYINGVGFYEHDSIVAACGEYLKALEIVETHFPNIKNQVYTSLTSKHLSRFMSMTYGRLTKLFSDQFMQNPAIICCKKALIFDSIEPVSPYSHSELLMRLGLQYLKLPQYDSADYYYNESLRNLPDTNNSIFRQLISHKAILNYGMDKGAEFSINTLKRVMVQADDESERLKDCLTIGSIYYAEGQFDSALVYLVPVFENDNRIEAKKGVAKFLRDIYNRKGDTVKAAQYALYLADKTTIKGLDKQSVSNLDELFQQHLQWEQEKADAERQEAVRLRRNRMIVVAVVLLVVVMLLAWMFHRRKMRQQRDEASQQMETERAAHRLEKASMSGRLKRSNEELRELKDQIRQQNDTAPKPETQAASFAEEPICRLIMERVNEGQFKSKVSYLDYSDYALSKEQITALREAADRHFGQFTIRLAKAYPDLTKSDLNYCCLYLLDLNDADIAALMQRAYNTVSDRSRKLKTLFGSEEPLSTILRGLATKEQFH